MKGEEYRRLRGDMIIKNLSQVEVAEHFGTTRQMVCMALKGQAKSKLARDICQYVVERLNE